MTDLAISKTNENKQLAPMKRIENYIMSPEVKAKMSDMMGSNAVYYLNQVLILVAQSSDLQKCNPESILISAMRAASLRLSVDPAKGQAWIIPYNGTATFQLGYKGIYELAMRTEQYKFINVIPIYIGEAVIEERMTGMHNIEGKPTGNQVIGRMLYFELFSGYKRTFYMTVEEIEAHARHYSRAYNNPKSKWSDAYERPKMEDKTVLMNGLRKWGRFNEADDEMLSEIESEANEVRFHTLPAENEVTVFDANARAAGPAISPAIADKLLDELGFPTDEPKQAEQKPAASFTSVDLDWARALKTPRGLLFADLTADQLTLILENKNATADQKKAASILIEFKITGNPF